jgi:hypothetical protein
MDMPFQNLESDIPKSEKKVIKKFKTMTRAIIGLGRIKRAFSKQKTNPD